MYRRPAKHLHREFLYLNHETVINSLSALEAGKVDEIISKVNEAREGGFGASLGASGANVSASKKKAAIVEEELVRTRTVFSAFDAWYKQLESSKAIGTFDEWSPEVRDELEIGDTIEFPATVRLTSVHLLLRTFIGFSERASNSGSLFAQTGEDLKTTQRIARMMREWLGTDESSQHYLVHMSPHGVDGPGVYGRMEDQFFVDSREAIEGQYRVIAQVDRMLEGTETASAIRVMSGVPATPHEIKVISNALAGLADASADLGVPLPDADIVITAPAVMVRPIAVWR